MNRGYASEALIASGAFLVYSGDFKLGVTMITLGCLGGCLSFLYFVSRATSEDNKKGVIYRDVKMLLDLIARAINASGDRFGDKNSFH